MKERPILFSAPMVQAILAGRKTQTRRIVKNPPDQDSYGYWNRNHGKNITGVYHSEDAIKTAMVKNFCPYGKRGDRLWVRETHIRRGEKAIYRADVDPVEGAGLGGMYGGWKPSIFMFRKHSRITLEITEVRVQRLQEISEEDCRSEGVEILKTNCDGECGQTPCGISRQPFIRLWESINGEESWAANPWVWAVSFQVFDRDLEVLR